MRRWLEQNIGTMSLRKDEMDTIRKVQQLYHEESGEVPENYEGDPFDYIAPVDLSMPTEKAFNQHF